MRIKLLVKTVLLLLSDEKIQNRLKTVVSVIVSPLLVVVLFLGGFGSASSDHNHAVVRAVFNQTVIPASVPAELKLRLEILQSYFTTLNHKIDELEGSITEGQLNKTQIRSIFFGVYFNQANLNVEEEVIKSFVDCFVEVHEIEIPIEPEDRQNEDEEGEVMIVRIVKVIEDEERIYQNLRSRLGLELSDETISIAQQITQIVDFGTTASKEGEGKLLSTLLEDHIPNSLQTAYVGGSILNPFDFDWRTVVTSEFGWRDNPFNPSERDFHSGIDFGVGLGVAIKAVNTGTVIMVRNYESGLGYFLVIDHGGAVLSVYGHCSRIFVAEGDRIMQGQIIAEVGSTGTSTGNHLHLELWENGQAINPRSRLE